METKHYFVMRKVLTEYLISFLVLSVISMNVFAVTVFESDNVVTINNNHIELNIGLSSGTWSGKIDGLNIFRNLKGTIYGSSTTTGFWDYTVSDYFDNIGTRKEVTFNMKDGGKLIISLYDNEYFFVARLYKSSATGTAVFSGEFTSGAPQSPSVWVAISDTYTNDREQQRATQLKLGDSQFSEKAIACWDGYNRPGLFIGTLGIEVRKQKTEITRIADGFGFKAWSNIANGYGEPFIFFATYKLVKSMERYAKIFQLTNNLKFPDWTTCGFCTWNAYNNSISLSDVLEIADQLVSTRLREYGYTLLQIDDGWQYGWRCSGSWWANEKFYGGPTDNDAMKYVVDEIHGRGLKAGLWIGPLMDEDDPDWRQICWGCQHKEFINPAPADCDGCGKYDVSDPDFVAWAPTLTDRITNNWGFDYIKFDFMSRLFGNGTPEEMRTAYGLFRKSMKPGTFFLYSNGRQWDAIGLIDGIRSGDDVAPNFNYSVHSIGRAVRAVSVQWYMNRKIWITDIDQIHVKKPDLTDSEAKIWATIGGLSGGSIFIPDRFWNTDEVPENRLELLKKIAPPYSVAARPADLFEHEVDTTDFPNIFVLDINKNWGNYYIVSVINWDTSQKNITVEFQKHLDVSPSQEFLVYDFWNKNYLGIYSGSKVFQVPGHDCYVLSFVPKLSIPQIISTDRHITQGGVDLENVVWINDSKQLTGTSNTLIRNIPYTMVLFVPPEYNLVNAFADTKPMQVNNNADGTIQLTVVPENTTINWVVNFSSGSSDIIAPSKITDLAVSSYTSNSVILTWTAPGDDGPIGTATIYDLRYSFTPIITENDFNNAIQYTEKPSVNQSGTIQNCVVNRLVSGTTYYFVVRTGDEVLNWSPISNCVSITTSGSPIQSSITVISPNGNEIWFTGLEYTVNWESQGAVGNVDIYLSTDSGTSWSKLVSNTANDGLQKIPAFVSPCNSCKIKVESITGSPSDMSDYNFIISSFVITNKPIISVTPNKLYFGEIKPDSVVSLTFNITNISGGTLSGTITTDKDWIKVDQEYFNSNNVTVTVTIDGKTLNKLEGQYTGKINISSNGGSTSIDIEVTAVCVLTKPNPFNPEKSKLTFFGSGIVPGKTTIKIYTLSGELVKSLNNISPNIKTNQISKTEIEIANEITWDGKNENDETVVNGIYLYIYESPKEKGVGKFTVIK